MLWIIVIIKRKPGICQFTSSFLPYPVNVYSGSPLSTGGVGVVSGCGVSVVSGSGVGVGTGSGPMIISPA
jgi:hypothetical protein